MITSLCGPGLALRDQKETVGKYKATFQAPIMEIYLWILAPSIDSYVGPNLLNEAMTDHSQLLHCCSLHLLGGVIFFFPIKEH